MIELNKNLNENYYKTKINENYYKTKIKRKFE